MIWGITFTKEKVRQERKDKNWFTWYPVRLKDGRWCWLEQVRCEYWTSWGNSGYDYYLVEKCQFPT